MQINEKNHRYTTERLDSASIKKKNKSLSVGVFFSKIKIKLMDSTILSSKQRPDNLQFADKIIVLVVNIIFQTAVNNS